MKWTYKQLCQSLAETEYALRTNSTGRCFSTNGRHEQLKYMEQHYPEKHAEYIKSWEERMKYPVDTKTILETVVNA